ncbi:MAG: TolC family protein [candidate division KSB1 bacterium]|nr:TolC family protein [candidate division KSB1 bacterium]
MKHSMMKISWMFITILLLAGVARARQLQENPMADTSAVANLSEIIEIALKENPGIRSAEKRYRALLAVPAQVSSLPDPVLGYTRWVKNVETRVGPQENVFVLSQRIPFPGKLGLKGKIALQDAEAARQDYEAARRDVLFKVKSTYADLYNIDQSLRILRTYKRILRDFADVAATKYATGSGIQAQVLKAQVEISTIEVKELAFEKRRTGVVARLNALMNRSADAPIGTAVDIDLPPVTLAEQQLLAIARERRQELKATKYMIEKASFAKKLARKNYLPDFNFQTTYISIPKVNRHVSGFRQGRLFGDAGHQPADLARPAAGGRGAGHRDANRPAVSIRQSLENRGSGDCRYSFSVKNPARNPGPVRTGIAGAGRNEPGVGAVGL